MLERDNHDPDTTLIDTKLQNVSDSTTVYEQLLGFDDGDHQVGSATLDLVKQETSFDLPFAEWSQEFLDFKQELSSDSDVHDVMELAQAQHLSIEGDFHSMYNQLPSQLNSVKKADQYIARESHDPMLDIRIPENTYRTSRHLNKIVTVFFSSLIRLDTALDGPTTKFINGKDRHILPSPEFNRLSRGEIDPLLIKAHCFKLTDALLNLHESGCYLPPADHVRGRKLPGERVVGEKDKSLCLEDRVEAIADLLRQWKLCYKDITTGGRALEQIVRCYVLPHDL